MTAGAGKILGVAGYVLLAFLAAAALGVLVAAIPILGELGPVLMSYAGPWITLVSLIGAAMIFRRWRAKGQPFLLAMTILAAFAGVATAFAQARQIAVARKNGAKIDLVQALLAHSQTDTTLVPLTAIYARHNGEPLPLDIYRPEAAAAGADAPVLVYIHGGGWNAQTLKQRQADYRWFAERGYLVISLEYTLASEKRHTWDVVQPQLGCALAWVGANAGRYGGDASRLALWGESAGGNLVLNLSYMANQGSLKLSCPGEVPKVDATIALYPVVDPARMFRNPDVLIGGFGRLMTVNYTGGSPDQFPDRYAVIASSMHISAAAPPTLLIVPEADHLVVPAAAAEFAGRARAAGIDMQMIRMPYAEQAFDLRSGSIGNQMVREVMLRFLNQKGLRADNRAIVQNQ
ncbi:alpha/beta hydrolase [Novosphingobium sp. G106]|uniref:alpha/beta hydrolase n=1 Tax=Novosphingobium sp. G106 TaxID=2849500 RepID=UPI001C2D0743|nr:alpha/beta hydrolase [Novosphingobium sp. G106]MBV1689000.1 alpha/beta hydrolase [Novosphingobium sp. G106]